MQTEREEQERENEKENNNNEEINNENNLEPEQGKEEEGQKEIGQENQEEGAEEPKQEGGEEENKPEEENNQNKEENNQEEENKNNSSKEQEKSQSAKKEEKKNSEKEEKKKEEKKQTKAQIDGWNETLVLKKRVGNPRYLGYSTLQSSNTFQNSSYMYSIPKSYRFGKKTMDKSTTYYNLPELKSTRYTSFGFGKRSTLISPFGLGTPAPCAYKILTSTDWNVKNKKGPSIAKRLNTDLNKDKKPGPGSFNVGEKFLKLRIPITIKSRTEMFYDDDLRKKAHCVSMQRYHPKHTLTEPSRFKGCSFGYGNKGDFMKTTTLKYPGPGAHNIVRYIDKGLKGLSPIN